ncbi:hypothetical protein ACVWYG_000876 [Pedobacter sp. UYEF25]
MKLKAAATKQQEFGLSLLQSRPYRDEIFLLYHF